MDSELFDNIPVCIIQVNDAGEIINLNKTAKQSFEVASIQELSGKPLKDYLFDIPKDDDLLTIEFENDYNEKELVSVKGNKYAVGEKKFIIKDKENNLSFVLLTDIEEQKKAQKMIVMYQEQLEKEILDHTFQMQQRQVKLSRSETKFRTLYDSSSDAVILQGNNGIMECNRRTLELFECKDRSQFEKINIEDLSPPLQPDGGNSKKLAEKYFAEALKEGHSQFEWTFNKFDSKSVFTTEILISSMKIDEEHVFQVVVRDITERKLAELEILEQKYKLEKFNQKLKQSEQSLKEVNASLLKEKKRLEDAQQQLLQSEKMASIGQLAAGVAHEVNNPIGFVNSNLSTIAGYSEDLLEILSCYNTIDSLISAGKFDELRGVMEKVSELKQKADLDFIIEDLPVAIAESKEGADRVKKIVQDLKTFSHVDEAELKEVDVNVGIESTLNIVWNEIKYKATVRKDLQDIPLLYCYPQQINQVILNMLVNAAHAIEEQGEIFIHSYNDSENVYIEISDTGKGIEQENLEKIFEPFFTTKEVGKGTGLGLSMSYNIIKAHDGEIKVTSELGKGSKFTIILPIKDAVNEKA